MNQSSNLESINALKYVLCIFLNSFPRLFIMEKIPVIMDGFFMMPAIGKLFIQGGIVTKEL